VVGWWSFAVVKGFWPLWDNIITVAIVMLLTEAYCVRVLLYNAEKQMCVNALELS
jgi:hypothetical protein